MAPAREISIQVEPGRIVLSAGLLISAQRWTKAKSLVSRLLAIPVVAYVKVDLRFGEADIRLDPRRSEAQATSLALREISTALRAPITDVGLNDGYQVCQRFGLSRLHDDIVGGEIRWIRSGETCLSHPLLQGKCSVNLVIKRMLEWDDQITLVTLPSESGSVIIHHPPELSPDQLLVRLERILAKIGEAAQADNSRQRLLISGGCLALAIPAELMAPVLIPVVAATLIVANARTLGLGMYELMVCRWRLPALYTVIMGTTLITGQVLAAALMQVSIAAWYCWSNRRLRQLVENLLNSTDAPDAITTIPQQALTDAADARLTSTERPSASAQMEQSAFGKRSALQERLMRSLARISSSRTSTERCHDQASRFIPFTFATGVAAIATADVSTLGAVLRPDFSTGPSISEQILAVALMGDLLQRGWLVTHSEAIARFVVAERIIVFQIDDPASDPARASLNPGPSFEELRIVKEEWPLPTANVSVIVDVVSGPFDACVNYAGRLATTETNVAVCGPSDLMSAVPGTNLVRVATDRADQEFDVVQADFVAIADKSSIRSLLEVILSGTQRARNGWSIVLTCNFASVLGAFVIGLTSLHVVALTNLGTWAAFAATSGHDVRRKLGQRFPGSAATAGDRADIDPNAEDRPRVTGLSQKQLYV